MKTAILKEFDKLFEGVTQNTNCVKAIQQVIKKDFLNYQDISSMQKSNQMLKRIDYPKIDLKGK